MKKMAPYLSYITFIVTLIVFFSLASIHAKPHRFSIASPSLLVSGWEMDEKIIDLPTKVEAEKHQLTTISRELDAAFVSSQTLLIRSSLQEIYVYLDGQVIYEKTFTPTFTDPYASLWHIIKLPGHSNGSILSITFSSPYSSMAGTLNPIYYGSEVSLYNHLFLTYGIRLFMSVMVGLIGLFILFSSYFTLKMEDKGFASIGLFAVFLSLWMLAESRMLQFFTGNTFLLGTLAYVALMLLPFPLIHYLKERVFARYKPLFTGLTIVFMVYFILSLGFVILNVYDFFELVGITQLLIAFYIVIALGLSFYEYFTHKNLSALAFIKVFGIFVVFIVLEIVSFISGDFTSTSSYLSIGLGIIMVSMLFYYAKFIFSRIKQSNEKAFYERLAYEDYLTHGPNRMAYERDLEARFIKGCEQKTLRLIVGDIDNLKAINDTFGHTAGDLAISKAYEVLNKTFGKDGTCYRIGGDEFICLVDGMDDALYHERIQELNAYLIVENTSLDFTLHVSLGSSVCDDSLKTPKDLIQKADLSMYKFKREGKEKP